MFRKIKDDCGECSKPVGKTERQQIFLYSDGWHRVCERCLNKLKPSDK